MNPLLALLRRRDHHNRKAELSKSSTSADNLDKTGGFEGVTHTQPVALTGGHHNHHWRHQAAKVQKSVSESNLLQCDLLPDDHPDGFPDPPAEDELKKLSISATLETVTGGTETGGFYRSFDDLDDIDDHLMGVLAHSNPLEAAVVLRGDNSSQNRNSFNSSDSGRMSDTYAETSANSSVQYSNLSNCSGDSGAPLSEDCSKTTLEVLKEQEVSPDFAPFDQEIYGNSVGVYQTPLEAKLGSFNQNGSTVGGHSDPQRFATVRKSMTLPHGLSNSAATTPSVVLTPRKRKDLGNFLGLRDEGPGSPSREVTQCVAMQNLPQENCNEKIEKFLGNCIIIVHSKNGCWDFFK
jgi:hypothetical protein